MAAGSAGTAERTDAACRDIPATADDLDFQAFVAAFLQELGQLDWIVGRNMRIDTRWASADAAAIRRHAAELVALAPDVILAHGGGTVGPLLQATRTPRVRPRRTSRV